MFENDVFISYSHRDDKLVLGREKGWVSELHQTLEERIGVLLGLDPKIWRDSVQSGNTKFTDDFLYQLSKTVALVPVFSPSYFTSDYCPLEFEAFCKACQDSGGLSVGRRSRIFKVVRTQLPDPERIPAQVRGFTGYDFFAVDGTTKYVREFGCDSDKEARQKFIQKVDDLAQDISRLLRELRGMEPRPNPEVCPQRGLVYLATTTSDLNEDRDTLRRDLIRNGYTVLPESPLPVASPEIEAAVRGEIARCQVSIHLIGRTYGAVPEGTELSVPVLQNDLAAERSWTALLPRLVWLAPVLPGKPVEARQEEFIERLKSEPDLQGTMDLLEGGTIQELIGEVYLTLEARSKPESKPGPRRPGGKTPPQVYLICDPRDQDKEELQRLRSLLFEAGCEPVLPLFEGDEAEIRQEHEGSLRTCAAVLFYWGAGSEAWRRRKQSEVLKSAGLGRTGGAPPSALYVAAPESGDKRNLLTHSALVLRPTLAGPTADLLAPFLEQVPRGEGQEDDPDEPS